MPDGGIDFYHSSLWNYKCSGKFRNRCACRSRCYMYNHVIIDDDMIIHVAPASAGTPVPELTRAFIVPKGTMVKINAAIWHLCPLPLNNEVLHAMIILPECTYANDCTVVDFEEKDWFRITI